MDETNNGAEVLSGPTDLADSVGGIEPAEDTATHQTGSDQQQDALLEQEEADSGQAIEEERQNRAFNQALPELSDEELDTIADTAIEVIRSLLVFFDAGEAEIEEYEGEEQELIFDIIGENLAMLIGRHGRTLEAMQYLVSAIVSKRIGQYYPVVVDVEGYVNRRKQKLVSLAKSGAAKAIRQKRSVRLRPMSPYERRVVHMALKDDKRVHTESEGVDPNRQIVIYLN